MPKTPRKASPELAVGDPTANVNSEVAAVALGAGGSPTDFVSEKSPPEIGIGGPPTNLDFEKSMMFFHAYMYGPLQGKLRIYGARAISAGPVAMPSDWEVFASMIVNDMGRKLLSGIDLTNHEVKSAKRGSSYEYQYHKNTGREKLANDMLVGHLFFDYADNLKEVDLRYAHGSAMKAFFDKWLSEFPKVYEQQRFRRSISYSWVKEHGELLMTIKDGEVVFPELEVVSPPVVVEPEPEPDV